MRISLPPTNVKTKKLHHSNEQQQSPKWCQRLADAESNMLVAVMSANGYEQIFQPANSMSALPPKPDINELNSDVRL